MHCPSDFDRFFEIAIEPRRNQFDYIYLRSDLSALHGGKLKAKRNHVNRFIAEYPHFVYQPLIPEFFDQCRLLVDKWKEDRDSVDTIVAERRAMERVFVNELYFAKNDHRGRASDCRLDG